LFQAIGREQVMRIGARRAIGWTAITAGAVVALFWIVYFATDATLGHGDPRVAAYEAAFPLADAAFATMLLLAGWSLLRAHAAGPFLLVGAAAISVYLGILDLTFYATHGFYARPSTAVAIELAVNAACVGGGLVGLRAGWRLWTADVARSG
jgi:hypothetical protein